MSKKPVRSGKPAGLYRIVLALVRLAARFLLHLSPAAVKGREHIPVSGGFILVSNHASLFDPPILAIASPRQMTYIAKIELFTNPLFGWFIRKLGAYPIRRGVGDREAFQTAIDLLDRGHALVVFPEGTRTTTGAMGRIRIGAAMMALAAGVPLIPAYIEGSFAAWPKGGRIRRSPVRVRIGPPIRMNNLENDARGARALTVRLKMALEDLKTDASE